MHLRRTRIAWLSIVVAASWLLAGVTRAEQPPRCETPLTETALKQMITGGVPAARLRQLIASCGIDIGQADAAATEARLKQIGLAAAVLTALAPPSTAVVGTTWVSPFDGRTMVFVPAGKFRMGSDATEPGRDADEDAHEVAVDSFWIDVDEVTNEAYRRFLISRPEWQKGNVPSESRDANYLKNWEGTAYPEGRGEWPVGWVSWPAARAYAAWAGKRLPTEAEWEYAARAGSTTRFWWGDSFDASRVVTDPKSAAAPDRRTNPWGIRDGVGSVWEWTSTLYRPYPYLATDGREDPRAAGARSARGGSRVNGESFQRSANRSMEDAAATSDLLGFRCAR